MAPDALAKVIEVTVWLPARLTVNCEVVALLKSTEAQVLTEPELITSAGTLVEAPAVVDQLVLLAQLPVPGPLPVHWAVTGVTT